MLKKMKYTLILIIGIGIGYAIGLTMDPLDRAIRKAQKINRSNLQGISSLRQGGSWNLFGILKPIIPLAQKIQLDPTFSNQYINTLMQNIQKKEYSIQILEETRDFIDLATKKVFVDKSLQSYLISLGQIQLKNGMISEAVTNLQKAYDINPSDSSVAQLLATAYLGLYYILPNGSEKSQVGDKAIQFLKLTLKTKPNSINTIYNLALIYTDQGIYNQALPLFLEIVKSNPEHIEALLGIARIYYEQGDIDKARKLYEQTEAMILELKNKQKFLRKTLNQGLLDQKLRTIRNNLEIIYASPSLGIKK